MKVRLQPPTKLWLGLFGIWIIFLSGIPGSIIGAPGVIQAVRLNRLLEQRQNQLAIDESEIARLEGEASRLEKSRVAQEREIRRVLGYAAPDEIIFDFSMADRGN